MNPAQNANLEEIRLSILNGLDYLNSPKEARFDKITSLCARVFSVPICTVGFIYKDIISYKSTYGLDIKQVNRTGSLEDMVIHSGEVFWQEDVSTFPSLANNPIIASGPKLKFYTGVVLKSHEGVWLGVFSIADRLSRKISENEINALKDLASWVEAEIHEDEFKRNELIKIDKYEKTLEMLTTRTRELEEAKAQTSVMLDSIGDGVVGINDKGDIIYLNYQAKSMTGFEEEELMGKPLIHALKLVDAEGREISLNKNPIRNALFTRKKILSHDFYYQRKNASLFPVSITATPVVVANQIVGGVNVFRDITKEKEVDRMKTEFISLASHQLRTPLSAMKWFSEMLLDEDVGGLNSEQKELLNNIYQSNERMIELVNALLNISRIESGRIIIEPKPTNLKDLINGVVKEIQQRLNQKRQTLAISVHEALPEINIDPKLIRHVYMNLLTNASKYTPEAGEIVVMVSRSGDEIISQVSDNGYGIPKSQQNQVFKKFFRAENVVKIETDGTGLGLYLTKAIVESSGGRIWFESEEGKGATFWFSLPISGMKPKKGEVSLDS